MLDPLENFCSPLRSHQKQDPTYLRCEMTWGFIKCREQSQKISISQGKPIRFCRCPLACFFFSLLASLRVFALFLLAFFPFFSRGLSDAFPSLPSVKLSRLSFLNPCPCSKEQVLLDRHKDGEIVGTCKCLLAIFCEKWKQKDSDACSPTPVTFQHLVCIYLQVNESGGDAGRWLRRGYVLKMRFCEKEPNGCNERGRRKEKETSQSRGWYMQSTKQRCGW